MMLDVLWADLETCCWPRCSIRCVVHGRGRVPEMKPRRWGAAQARPLPVSTRNRSHGRIGVVEWASWPSTVAACWVSSAGVGVMPSGA